VPPTFVSKGKKKESSTVLPCFSDTLFPRSITMRTIDGNVPTRLFKRNVFNWGAEITNSSTVSYWQRKPARRRFRFRKFRKFSRGTWSTKKSLLHQARVYSPLISEPPPRIPSVVLPRRPVKVKRMQPGAVSEDFYIKVVRSTGAVSGRSKSLFRMAQIYSPLIMPFPANQEIFNSKILGQGEKES
jgi:hypothetical protein